MSVNPDVQITTMEMNPPGTLAVSGTVAENLGMSQTVTITVAWTGSPAGSPRTSTTTSSAGRWNGTVTGVPTGQTVEVTATCGNSSHTRDYPLPVRGRTSTGTISDIPTSF